MGSLIIMCVCVGGGGQSFFFRFFFKLPPSYSILSGNHGILLLFSVFFWSPDWNRRPMFLSPLVGWLVSWLLVLSHEDEKMLLFIFLYFINCKVLFAGKIRSTFFPTCKSNTFIFTFFTMCTQGKSTFFPICKGKNSTGKKVKIKLRINR